jgi:hypothetical protein
MAIPKKNVRGLQDIRTLSGNVDQRSVPHRAYMRITVLEMEKARREKEKESAMHRVKNIDGRFREIEAEKDELLRAVGERERTARRQPSSTESKSETSENREEHQFRVRY